MVVFHTCRRRGALQVPGPRPPLADAEKEWATEWFRGQTGANIGVSDLEWLDQQSDLKVDGPGRIFAFPWVLRGVEVDRLPSDVYDPDGSRIFSGWMTRDIEGMYWQGGWKPGPMLGTAWQTAAWGHVCVLVADPATGVWSLIRYRLEFPE